MASKPGWVEEGLALLAPADLGAETLGSLWALGEQLAHLKDSVDPPLLEQDFLAGPERRLLWADLQTRRLQVHEHLAKARQRVEQAVSSGQLSKEGFRKSWELLGFEEHASRASTAADDYLEGLWAMDRLSIGEDRPAFGLVNLASRAARISLFLSRINPTEDDVLFDLGSGSGKFALTVAASSAATVVGVELGASYVVASQVAALTFRLNNVRFVCGAVQETDLSSGTVFYLFHPFWGDVARQVASQLAALARQKDITVYAQGPASGFGEHFDAHAGAGGAFQLTERFGLYNEGFVLRSSGGIAR